MSRRKILLTALLVAGMSMWTACGAAEQNQNAAPEQAAETEQSETAEPEASEESQEPEEDLHLQVTSIWQTIGVPWNIMNSRKTGFMTVLIRS